MRHFLLRDDECEVLSEGFAEALGQAVACVASESFAPSADFRLRYGGEIVATLEQTPDGAVSVRIFHGCSHDE